MDGVVRVKVRAALITFNPQKGVIMSGTVTATNLDMLRLTTSFCDDLFVPRSEWGKLKMASHPLDGKMSLFEEEKPMCRIVVGDRVRFRVIETAVVGKGLRVTGSVAGDYLGNVDWFEERADGGRKS